jgi:DNA-binding NarL/FixJ family response regulator
MTADKPRFQDKSPASPVAGAPRCVDNPSPEGQAGALMAVRVLVADDHPLMRAALRQSVAQTLDDAEILEAADFDQVQQALALADAPVDLVLLDLHMPGMNGFIGLVILRSEHPATPVVIVSAHEDAVTIHRALDHGASGYVPKSAPAARISEAIRTVLDGGVWTPETDAPPDAAEADFAERVATLTPQQLRVLAGITAGKLNKQIAYEMNVTEATVKAHVTAILRKLGVQSRTQAVIAAGRLVLDGPDPAGPPPAG